MPLVPCPQCAKPMEQDDGFCGLCGAIIDDDLLDTGTDDDSKTTPNLMVPDLGLIAAALDADPARGAVVAALDLGGFDERTDIAPPPPVELPPPPIDLPPPPVDLPPPPVDLPPPPVDLPPPPVDLPPPPVDLPPPAVDQPQPAGDPPPPAVDLPAPPVDQPPPPVAMPLPPVDLPAPPVDLPPPPVDLPPPVAAPAAPSSAAAAPPPAPAQSPAPKAAEKPADAFQAFLEESTGAFPIDGAGVFEEETGTHRADRQAMVQPQVVLRPKAGVDGAALSPFEQHVLSFLDGKRPLARLRKKAGLTFADLKVAIGMLADRGALEVVGTFKPDVRGMLDHDDLDDSHPFPAAPPRPQVAAPPRPQVDAPPPPVAQWKDTRTSAMQLPGQGAKRAAMPSPGHGAGPPRTPTPPPRAVAPAPKAAAVPDAHARAQANQLLERALAEQRAGKKQAALALALMASELLPGDPRIEELRRMLLAR